jgi:hypothetical protein
MYIDFPMIVPLYVDISKRKMKINDVPDTILVFFIYDPLFI